MRELPPGSLPEPYLTRDEFARVLGCSVVTVDRMRAEGMPSVRWGRRMVRIRASEALAWLDSKSTADDGSVPSVASLEARRARTAGTKRLGTPPERPPQ